MSELTKIIDEAETHLANLQRDISAGALVRERLSHIQTICLKYERKIELIDPVTGKPVYGGQMKVKTSYLAQLVQQLIGLLDDNLAFTSTDKVAESAPQSPDKGAPAASNVLDFHIIAQNREREDKLKSADSLTEKDSQRSQKFLFVNRFRNALLEKLSSLNRIYAQASLSQPRLSRSTIISKLLGEMSSHNAMHVCEIVIPILEGIIRNPDDQRARTIRWRHPQLQEKILTYGEEIFIAFVAVGFEVSLERLSTETLISIESYVSSAASSEGADTASPFRDELYAFFRLGMNAYISLFSMIF